MFRKISILISLFVAMASVASGQKAVGCSPATDNDKTIWGHIAVEFDAERSISKLSGTVRAPDDSAIKSALVEVFVDDGNSTPTFPSAKRVIGCTTSENGEYRFTGLKNGNYVLAVGANGFNITFVRFKLDNNDRAGLKKLNVNLELGT